jgi:hypothetical protein
MQRFFQLDVQYQLSPFGRAALEKLDDARGISALSWAELRRIAEAGGARLALYERGREIGIKVPTQRISDSYSH